MKKKTLALMVTAGVLGTTTFAQEPADIVTFGAVQAAPAPPPVMWDQPFGIVAVEPFAGTEGVENAPYSADIVTEVIQEFADGNRIERRTTATVARDSRGRVRREQELAAIGPVLPHGDMRMVTITDPAAGIHYSLDPHRRTAIRMQSPRLAHEPGTPVPPPPPMHFSSGGANVVFERHVAVEAPLPPNVRTEKLGSKDFDGVAAEGTRTTTTIPAGEIGNVRPIETVSERWYSPELRVVVYSRRSDPRFGETTYRLTNIVRAEPDATLFQVPPDYKTEEVKPPFESVIRSKVKRRN